MLFRRTCHCILILSLFFLISCSATHSVTASKKTSSNYYSFYDDSTLSNANNPVLLPYNRFLNPAGTIVRFGDDQLENHSLDCITIPGENVMVTEDRYGLNIYQHHK